MSRTEGTRAEVRFNGAPAAEFGGHEEPHPFPRPARPEPREDPSSAAEAPYLPSSGDDDDPTIGGEAFSAPRADEMVQASGGSLAAQLRAQFEGMAATKEFGVPGYLRPNGEPSLIIEAQAFGDRSAFARGVSNEVYIAKSTHRLFFVDDSGRRQEIVGGWGPTLAKMIGVDVTRATDLVAQVISKPDPDNPKQRIPNVAGIGTLAGQLVEWATGETREAEEALGE